MFQSFLCRARAKPLRLPYVRRGWPSVAAVSSVRKVAFSASCASVPDDTESSASKAIFGVASSVLKSRCSWFMLPITHFQVSISLFRLPFSFIQIADLHIQTTTMSLHISLLNLHAFFFIKKKSLIVNLNVPFLCFQVFIFCF